MRWILVELAVVLFLLAVNGGIAMAEIALIAARRSRLKQLSKNSQGARWALMLSNDPQQVLNTCLLAMTVVSTITALYAGLRLIPSVTVAIEALGVHGLLASLFSFLLVVAVLVVLTVLIAELIPKRLAIAAADQIAVSVARPMATLCRVAKPIMNALSTISSTLFMSEAERTQTNISEEEINLMVAEGTAAGFVDETEQDMVRRVLRLGDRRVDSLMTPRKELESIDVNEPDDVVLDRIASTKRSYYLVCEGSVDSVKGMLRVKDLWRSLMNLERFRWQDFIQPALTVPNTVSALRVLEIFRQAGKHVAVVLDEFGGTDGMVTLNDVTEAVLGDLPTSVMPDEGWLTQRADGSWLVDGAFPLDEFRDQFGVALEDGDEGHTPEYQTLAGFIVARLGHLPASAESFEHAGYRFEVVDMDGHRVDKVLISRQQEAAESSEASGI